MCDLRADTEKTQGVDPRRIREAMEKERAAANRCPEGGQLRGHFDCPQPTSESDILAELFRYHPPNIETLPKFAAINQAAKNFAEVILQNCPPSRDRSNAIEMVQDARMKANRAIALNGLSL